MLQHSATCATCTLFIARHIASQLRPPPASGGCTPAQTRRATRISKHELGIVCDVPCCMSHATSRVACAAGAVRSGVGWSGVAACCSPYARSLATPDAPRRCGTPTLHEQTSCVACFAQDPSRLRACVRGLVALEHRNESASLGPGQMWRRQSALAECPNGSGAPAFLRAFAVAARPRRCADRGAVVCLFVCLFVCLLGR